MIDRKDIKEGLFFTLSCEWDEKRQRFVYILDEEYGRKFVCMTHCTNTIFRVEFTNGFGYSTRFCEVSVCDLDYHLFTFVNLDIIARKGSVVNVSEDDADEILDIYLKAEEIDKKEKYFLTDGLLFVKNMLKIKLNAFFNRDFRQRYNQKKIGE